MEIIEQAIAGDIPHHVALLTILFFQEADFTPDPEKQARGLKMIIDGLGAGAIFVARDKDEVVGMVSLLFTVSTAEGGRTCWLEDMVVRADRRQPKTLRHPGSCCGSADHQRPVQRPGR